MKSLAYYIGFGLLLAACTADSDEPQQPRTGRLNLTSSVGAFVDESEAPVTRTNLEGNDFEAGDRIKMKIVCPYTSADRAEFGETTYSNTADGLWLLKWNGSGWTQIEASDSVDMMAHYRYDSSYNLFGVYEAQQTPYVYTASTWNENVFFMAPNALNSAPRPFSQYSYIFQANQSNVRNYKKSDLLWAQTYMQTGSYNVHLAFNHVMACLKFTFSGATLSDETVVTLEGMPDIDQREVVVGDYYAPKIKNVTQASGSDFDYSYRFKCSCDKEYNGKVLGIAVINDADRKSYIYPLSGFPTTSSIVNYSPSKTVVANTGVYTAYYDDTSKAYYLIVPPCVLSENATLWIRDGAARYKHTLERTSFEQGKLYPVNITLTTPPPPTPADDSSESGDGE